jgi:transposase
MRFVPVKSTEQQAVLARHGVEDLRDHLRVLDERIAAYDRELEHQARGNEAAVRLMGIAGVGALTASATVASVGPAHEFANGRQFAAWLGLTPRQWSTGGKTRLGRITKRGDPYLRNLLVMGARAVLRMANGRSDKMSRWALALKERRGYHTAAVAIAAKNARIMWAMLARGDHFRTA